MSTGYDKRDPDNTIDMVRRCEDSGVAAIFVHGRLVSQGYAGTVDYDFIKKIKESVRIPVFGSGNILSGSLAKKMFDETSCDGILVARGALGNPWIFNQINNYLMDGSSSGEISIEEKKEIVKKHLLYVEKYREMSRSGKIGFMKKIAIWYLKKIPLASRMREKIASVKNYEEILTTISSIN